MDFHLKSANKKDMEELYSIKKHSIMPYVSKIWGWNEEYQLDDFEKSFVAANVQKIMVKGQCVGFVETSQSAAAVNINEIHVTPQYQNMGIGSSIIKEIISQTKTQKKRVTLGCFKYNSKAKRLYLRLGFKQAGETQTHYLFETQN